MPSNSQVTDAVTGSEVLARGSSISFNLYPGEVRALVVKDAPALPTADGGMMSTADGGTMAVDGGSMTADGGAAMTDSGGDSAAGNPMADAASMSGGGGGGGGCQATGDGVPTVTLFGLVLLMGLRRRIVRTPR